LLLAISHIDTRCDNSLLAFALRWQYLRSPGYSAARNAGKQGRKEERKKVERAREMCVRFDWISHAAAVIALVSALAIRFHAPREAIEMATWHSLRDFPAKGHRECDHGAFYGPGSALAMLSRSSPTRIVSNLVDRRKLYLDTLIVVSADR
jgi:hypothetical protein